MRKRRREAESFDELVMNASITQLTKVMNAGIPAEEAEQALGEAMEEAFDRSVPSVIGKLRRTAPRMIRHDRRARRKFQRLIIKYWDDPLGRFLQVAHACEECGSEFSDRFRPAAIATNDYRFEALIGMQARACRIAGEIYCLLSGGYSKGALSRCRTLHELAVTADIVATHGAHDGSNADLAERFVLHEVVTSSKDATEYQQNCEHLGMEPLTDAYIASLKEARDDLLVRFGSDYGQDYGWARPLFDKKPTFRDLEKLANLSHLRGYYRWASSEIHAGARGWSSNIETVGEESFLSTGASLRGLADPGHLALVSLVQTTVSVLLSPAEFSPRSTLAAKVLLSMLDDAGISFGAADEAVESKVARRTEDSQRDD